MTEVKTDRQTLGPHDWIQAALVLLAERGVEGVKVDVLARRIGITRGSFYWHFADRAALLREMREHWAFEATDAVIEEVDTLGAPPVDRLTEVITRWADAIASSTERAVRDWARLDVETAERLASIDRRRLAYLEGLVWASGIQTQDASIRAFMLYGLIQGVGNRMIATPELEVAATIDSAIEIALGAKPLQRQCSMPNGGETGNG